MFHYLEICKINGEDKKILVDALANIDMAVQAFYLLVDRDNGKTLMDTLTNIRTSRSEEGRDNNSEHKPVDPDDKYADLSKEDRELLEFADSLPEELELPGEFKHTGRYVLPKKSLQKLKEELGDVYEEVDSIEDVVELGIKDNISDGEPELLDEIKEDGLG